MIPPSTSASCSTFRRTATCIPASSNPTVAAVEQKIAALEGGVGALCTTSGQAASLLAVLNICTAGDHFVAASTIYGGTVNLFAVTLKKFGIECTFVDADAQEEEIEKAFRPNTKALFGETIANPAIAVLDLEKFARTAHRNGVPFLVDNTFATPVLCRPIEWGADIVVHSTTKYMDGHAIQVGGVIVDSGNFNWENGKFGELCTPDESYHGVTYTRDFGRAAYITKARVQLMRDFGMYPPRRMRFANLGLETLAVRMERYCRNANRPLPSWQGSRRWSLSIIPRCPAALMPQPQKNTCPTGAAG